MFSERDESITHLIAECKKLAQKEYKQRLGNIARIVHLKLCQKFGLVGEVNWYNHISGSVVENGGVKISWDLDIQTDHVIQHRSPDIVVLYKSEKRCHLTDIGVPGDKSIELKEQEKVDNYSKLRQEVKKILDLSQVVVVPVVIGALGMTSKRLKYWLKKLNVTSSIELLPKASLLGTAKIVRQVIKTRSY